MALRVRVLQTISCIKKIFNSNLLFKIDVVPVVVVVVLDNNGVLVVVLVDVVVVAVVVVVLVIVVIGDCVWYVVVEPVDVDDETSGDGQELGVVNMFHGKVKSIDLNNN